MDAGVEDEEEENKALTEELVASLRDTVRGEVFFVLRSYYVVSSSSFFMSFGYFFLSPSCLLIPNRIRACETRPPLTKDDDPLFLLFFVLSGSVRVRERVRHRFYRGWGAKRRWGRTGERKPFEKRIQSQPSRRRRRDRERQRHQWYAAVLCFRARRFFLTSPGVRRELESDSNALSVFSISLSRTVSSSSSLSFFRDDRPSPTADRPGARRISGNGVWRQDGHEPTNERETERE